MDIGLFVLEDIYIFKIYVYRFIKGEKYEKRIEVIDLVFLLVFIDLIFRDVCFWGYFG